MSKHIATLSHSHNCFRFLARRKPGLEQGAKTCILHLGAEHKQWHMVEHKSQGCGIGHIL